jgi:hypothetical protein
MNSHPEPLTMTFPFPTHPGEPVAEASAGPTGTPSDQSDASRLNAPPELGTRPAAAAASAEAAATARAPSRTPVAVSGPDGDDFRIDPSAAAAADATGRPGGLFWQAAALGVAACLGAAAGSAGLAAVNGFSSGPRTAQAESLDDLRALKESVAQLRSHVKSVGDNVAALRTNFNAATATLTSQLGRVSDEVEKFERLQADRRAAVSETPAPPAPNETKRPPVVEGWVLRSVSDGVALIEGRHGVIEIEPGDSLPGIGRIHEIKRQDGHWVVVTPKGLIVSAR